MPDGNRPDSGMPGQEGTTPGNRPRGNGTLEHLILFEVAGTTYAVRSEQVQLVEWVEAITRVPNAPPFVEGVMAVRGQVIPVVNMRRRFQLEPEPLTLRSRLIVIRIGGRSIGMLVDAAREFLRVDPNQIVPPPETLTGPIAAYLEGVVSLPNRLILLVNLPLLFRADEHEALSEPISPVSDQLSEERE